MQRKDWLAPHVRAEVRYVDGSAVGSAVSERLQNRMRRLLAPVYRALRKHGPRHVVMNGEDLLRRCFEARAFAELCGPSYPRLPPAVLFPDRRSIAPRSLVLTSTEQGDALEIDIPAGSWTAAGDWFATVAGVQPSRGRGRKSAPELEVFSAELRRRRFLKAGEPGPIRHPEADAVFLGHNMVAVRSSDRCVVVDPWFFPRARRYGSYQPIQPSELGHVSAALITHSHPDHFDPGALLMLGRTTPVIVPRVPRESLLALDMKARLVELGFTAVRELDWWKSTVVGDFRITAVPFHGEQPTSGKRLYPEVRNCGNCYLVRTPRLSCAFVADSGTDGEGSVEDVALEAFGRYGPIDVLFTGYRGWRLYPIQFFESSVRQYLLFVPPELYSVRQTIMNTLEGAVDTAEAWHARYLVPYGDGGAPWYAEIGLGPIDTHADADAGDDWMYFDPPPERCLDALRHRSQPLPGVTVGSPVRPLMLQTGESFTMVRDTPVVSRIRRRASRRNT